MIRHIGVYTPRDAGWIQPGSVEHRQIVTPSKIAAILGVSRWQSPFSVWHSMKGNLPDQPPSDRFDAGHDAETYAALRWLRKNPGWRVSAGEVQYVVDPEWFGFPAAVTLDRRATSGRAHRVLEVKTANDLYEWGDPQLDGNLDEGYTTQQLAQMAFTGWTKHSAHLMVLGPRWGFERIYETSFQVDVWSWMLGEIRKFWDSLQGDVAPDLDDSVATYSAVRAMHPDIEDGAEVELPSDLAEKFLTATTDLKIAESTARLAKTRVLDTMKRAQYARCNGTMIARRQPSSRGFVALYTAKGTK